MDRETYGELGDCLQSGERGDQRYNSSIGSIPLGLRRGRRETHTFPTHMVYQVSRFDFGWAKDPSASSELTKTSHFGGKLAKHPWSRSEMSRRMIRLAIERTHNLVSPSRWAMRVCRQELRSKVQLLDQVFESQSHWELAELVLGNQCQLERLKIPQRSNALGRFCSHAVTKP